VLELVQVLVSKFPERHSAPPFAIRVTFDQRLLLVMAPHKQKHPFVRLGVRQDAVGVRPRSRRSRVRIPPPLLRKGPVIGPSLLEQLA